MARITLNPDNPTGPLWLVWEFPDGSILFLAEVM